MLPENYARFLLVGICFVIFETTARSQEAVTPSGVPSTAATQPLSRGKQIDFESAARQLTAVYPIRLSSYTQVSQNSYNWKGAEDASLKCDIGFAPAALVVKGEFRDDRPFYQTMVHPSRPAWWKITYGADGVELLLDDPTTASQRLHVALNFSSHAVDPQVELLKSPLEEQRRFLPEAAFELYQAATNPPADTNFGFNVAIPYSALADPQFFTGPVRMTVRLHDIDGDPTTYLMMQETVEKK